VKNNNALLVYQTLVYSLKEVHPSIEMREFYYSNFMDIFEEDENIPVHILVEPLVNTIRLAQGSTFFFSSSDFEFFESVVKHPRIQMNSVIQIYDFLINVYTTDIVFAPLALNPLLKICDLFMSTEEV
jgi:hypothetical protein